MPDIFTPPADTYAGGSAVMRVTGPDGDWEYDNANEKWVNLKSGEALEPRDFAVRAGRPADAAKNTRALADEMRREESQLIAPLVRPPVQNPMPAYTPQDIARVQTQRPEPSIRRPASPEAWQNAIAANPQGASAFFDSQNTADALMQNFEYNQALQRAVAGGKSRAEAMMELGPMPGTKPPASFWKPQPSPATVEEKTYGGRKFVSVVQPNGTVVLHPTAESSGQKLSPARAQNVKLMEQEIASIRKLMADEADPAKLAKYRSDIDALIFTIQNEYKAERGAEQPPETPPVAVPASTVPRLKQPNNQRVRVKSKSGKIGTIPQDQLAQALKEGYTQY